MTIQVPPSSRRRTRQRGNSMLEGALALPPLFMVLFATIDFSVAILIKNTLQSAVREGVRYGVTNTVMTGQSGMVNSIKATVENNSLGFVNSSNASSISVAYYNPITLAVATGAGSDVGGNILQVSVTGFSWAWMVPYGRNAAPLQMAAISSDIVEANSSGVAPPL
jgi:Flp pilus assembly protein TadG